jgi:aryl-alcohol dehydrogenase-like predicted oxidoreductase
VIPRAPFGRTGHESSRLLLGGAAFARASQAEADEALAHVLEHGVNHVDTAASYGAAEDLIGDWIRRHGKTFFLATKTEQRERASAREQVLRSLERLQVDRVDLIQLHYLIEEDDWQRAMGEGGALEALVELRDEGLVRAIGVTGHGADVATMHRRSLERFDFDSILLPWNYPLSREPEYAPAFEETVAEAQRRGIAVQLIKSIAVGNWGSGDRHATTWYEPLRDQDDIDLAVHWVLGRDGCFLNAVGDLELLPRVVSAAERFERPPPDDAMEDLVGRRALEPLLASP